MADKYKCKIDEATLLGLPYGTACHRLRQLVMFDMARRLGENVCYRCGEIIESAVNLSIDHKKPWRKVSSDLFWSISNIAFSHKKCNRPDRPSQNQSRRQLPQEDKIWCGGCRDYLSKNQFYTSKSRWSGFRDRCRLCNQKDQAKRKARHLYVFRNCKCCGRPEIEVEFCYNRKICNPCYNYHQKNIMKSRR